jgi:competence protein ComEC
MNLAAWMPDIDVFLAAQRPNWPAWLAVAIGSGIALYFALSSEPPIWLGIVAFGGLVVPAGFLRHRPLLLIALAGSAAVALGFSAAQFRTAAVAAPQLDREIKFADVTGNIAGIELLPVGARVILENVGIRDIPAGSMPARVRIKLLKTTDEIHVGDRIRVTADLQPPAAPSISAGRPISRSWAPSASPSGRRRSSPRRLPPSAA